jgi:3-methylcrotonyl-CoA carboxylase alpha subunit
MISKLIVHAENREKAIQKMEDALSEYKIHGIATNISYLKKIMNFREYKENLISTHFCDDHTADIVEDINQKKKGIPTELPIVAFFLYSFRNSLNRNGQSGSVWNYIGYWRVGNSITFSLYDKLAETSENFEATIKIQNEKNQFDFEIGEEKTTATFKSFDFSKNKLEFYLNEDELITVHVSEKSHGKGFIEIDDFIFEISRSDILDDSISLKDIEDSIMHGSGNSVKSPMPGVVIKIVAEVGKEVKKGETLLVVEAMKMENNLVAPRDGVIESINVKVGDQVDGATSLIVLEEEK